MSRALQEDLISAEQFAMHIGVGFQLSLERGSAAVATLFLQTVEPSKWTRPSGSDGFSLTFEGPSSPALAQRIYCLANPGFGELDVFLVPISAEAGKREYQAVFN